MADTHSAQLRQLQDEISNRMDLNQQVQPRLSLDEIWEWVESLPPDTVAGYTLAATGCPVHHYLKDCGFNPTHVTAGDVRTAGMP